MDRRIRCLPCSLAVLFAWCLGFATVIGADRPLAAGPAMGSPITRPDARGGGDVTVEPGVGLTLARERSAMLSGIGYRIRFVIRRGEPVTGEVTISFRLSETGRPLQIDFAGSRVISVSSSGGAVPYGFTDEHIVIDPRYLDRGHNSFTVRFVSNDAPLHREQDYCYSLFVPDKARFVLPCFDQPDLKARFDLTLDMPAQWTAVSNTRVVSDEEDAASRVMTFARTEPLSTYFFSFAAGEFAVRTSSDGSFELHYLRSDSAGVERQAKDIFYWHGVAKDFMEEYTGIPYPFDRFAAVLIPSFPYSGMEHPGAILYRSQRLLLDESATMNDRVRRASVICHETAHMWFGDLVTMVWFDDVWLKEAFAQFMADKAVRVYEFDHDALFIASHYNNLYDVERTAGSNPIRQELDNLAGAGALYGDIIYHKPPVMLNQLELLMGGEALQGGLRAYLGRYRYGNATWEDLVAVLDPLTDLDCASWSRGWVMETGRPDICCDADTDEGGAIERLVVTQEDPAGRGRFWPQRFHLVFFSGQFESSVPVYMDSPHVEVPAAVGKRYDLLLPNGYGEGFGYFRIDGRSLEFIARNRPFLPDPLTRIVYYLVLRDNLLGGDIRSPSIYTGSIVSGLESETNEIILQVLLDYVVEAFWSFSGDAERAELAPVLERVLLDKIASSETVSVKSVCFQAYRTIVSTDDGVALLRGIWSAADSMPSLTLSERDYCAIALELASRDVDGCSEILDAQQDRIQNDDLRRQFAFVRGAASPVRAERDRFFDSLSDPANRRHEPWVLEALYYLHHPLRVRESIAYVPMSLEMLEEIRRTGDIFFPRRWLKTVLRYHTSDEAAAAVEYFLSGHPDLPQRLRFMVLLAADLPTRANRILRLREGNR